MGNGSWSAKEALSRAFSREFDDRRMRRTNTNLMERKSSQELELNETLVRAARIVEKHGDEYLDYFLRIQEEQKKAFEKNAALEEIKKIASSKTDLYKRNLIEP